METSLPPTTKPYTGMEFDSLHEAFLFYNEYAAIVGFSVRKDKTRKSNVDGSFLFRRFCCSKQGFPRNNNNSSSTATPDPLKVELRIPPLPRLTRRAKIEFKKRAQVLQKMRVGCSARLDVKRASHGKWVVQRFAEEHNHDCVALGETHLLRSHRTRSGADPDPHPQCIVPSLGMEFESHHKAFLFYNAYARVLGFIVRKDKTRKSNIDGSLLFRRFCCSREGYRRKSCGEDTQDQNQVRGGVVVKPRPRILPVTRVGCNARMEVKKTADGKWIVQKFIEQHNHEFDRLGDMNMLRSQKQLEPTQPQIVDPVFDEGTSTSQQKIIPSLSREPSGIDKAFSAKTRSRNRFTKKRKRKLEKGDLQLLFSYFSQMQTEDPSFFSSVQADEDDQMLSCFWADARSRMDFSYFGDVICIETNYGACQNDCPFIPILGVNHHLQTILLGCAITLKESEESFTWLLETMLKAMHGHCPLSIITDQDEEMQKAIDRVLPGTHHRLSLQYIFRGTAKNLSHLYNNEIEFGADFKRCIYEAQSSHEFETRWASLLDQYELCHNEWLDSIYAKRHKWVPTYSKHIFQADMITSQRSENMLSFFNDYLNRSLPLKEFVKQYEKALVNSREQEAYDDLSSYQVGHILKSDLPMEKQAAQVYTGSVFREFQKEFCDSFDYIAVETATSERNRTFVVSRWGENSNCTVSFYSRDDETRASCSCLNFEFVGILCRHILKVFTATKIALVPEVYYKKRWTKRAKWGIALDGRNKEMQTPYQNSISFRYSDLCRLALNICSKGAISLKAYQVAKSCILDKLRGMEKDAGEETQARINQLNFDGPRSSHPPVDVVENNTNSDHLATGGNNMLSVVHQVGFYDPTRVQARSQQPKRVRSSLGETQSSKKLRIAPDTSENVMPLHSRRGVPGCDS